MGVKQPELVSCIGRKAPIITHTRAPVGIIQPPFRRQTFGACGLQRVQHAPPPAKLCWRGGGARGRPPVLGARARAAVGGWAWASYRRAPTRQRLKSEQIFLEYGYPLDGGG